MIPELEKLAADVRELTARIEQLSRLLQPPGEALTTTQAAKLLGRKRRWVADMARIGRIRTITNCRPYTFTVEEIERIRKQGI